MGLERAVALLDPARRPWSAPFDGGYLDVVGDGPVAVGGGPWYRPALRRIARGPLGPGTNEERRIARLLLGLGPGDGVLDVPCAGGVLTRDFARVVGGAGLVVGVDADGGVLARAARDTPANVAFMRADAARLPFRAAAFDAVCCFEALHVLADPWAVLDELARVLTPGGRIAVMTTCRTRTAPARTWDRLVGDLARVRMFEPDEITSALSERGFEPVRRRVSGLAQFVGGRLGRTPAAR